MMKKRYFVVLICLISLLACKENVTLLSSREFILELINENKAISCSENDTCNIDRLPENLPESCFVYIMNASCSYCIYSFISFYKYEEAICPIPVCIIVDESFRQQVEYYLEQSGIKIDNSKLFMIDNTDNIIPNKNIDNDDLNGHIFLLEDGHCIDHVCYLGESMVFEE